MRRKQILFEWKVGLAVLGKRGGNKKDEFKYFNNHYGEKKKGKKKERR
jgi:hypothetical protein